MRRRRLTMLLAGLAIMMGSSLVLDPARASNATSIDDSGWWWRVQTNAALPLPGPPTVAAGQLLVQGAPDGATAIAAVAATLAEGEANPVLTLKVAPGSEASGEGAVLLACQAGSPWLGGDAKPWAEKPQPACDAGGVRGERAADGASWSFDLTALQFNDQVNVILVPGTVEGQQEGAHGSTFSLTFDEPMAEAIQTSPGEPPPPPTPSTELLDSGGGGDFTAPPADTGSFNFDSPSVNTADFALPAVEAALPDVEQGLTPVAPSVQDQTPLLPASVPVDPRSPHARSVGVLLLLLGGGAVYLTARQQQPIGPDGVSGGLGRWVSPRWGAPPALRG